MLPIRYEIHLRKFTFLHHIVNLSGDDPVRMLYENMKRLPHEKNWLNELLMHAAEYNIDVGEEKLISLNRETYKTQVKKVIQDYAFNDLKKQCLTLTKTKELKYESFEIQKYLLKLYPRQSSVLLQRRAKCLKIKTHRPYQFQGTLCRWCNMVDETLDHIINCAREEPEEMMCYICMNDINKIDMELEAKLVSYSSKILHFLDLVDY